MPTPRLAPLDPPYPPALAAALEAMMPPGLPPLRLFRTLAHNPRILDKIRASNLLDRGSLPRREREIVILRATARAGGEYEWGVHVAFFAERVGLTPAQVAATARGDAEDPVWSPRDRLLLRLVDQLHDSARHRRRALGRAGRRLRAGAARRAGRTGGLLPHDLVRGERVRDRPRRERAAATVAGSVPRRRQTVASGLTSSLSFAPGRASFHRRHLLGIDYVPSDAIRPSGASSEAARTAGRSSGSTFDPRQPENQRPDDARSIDARRGSVRRAFARCRLAFRST